MNRNQKRLRLKERLGFTLVEVIVVLAIFGSATALAAPNLLATLDNGKGKADAAQMDYLLNAFMTEQAPFFDDHINEYDMLNPIYDNGDGTVDAEEALNRYLQDVLDPSKDAYIDGVQCVTTETSLKDGTSVFQAESANGMLWISCRMDRNRSNGELRIPRTDQIDYKYSAGEGIRWGDSLLYIGDYENLESRFVAGTCKDYQMEAGFLLDNHIHQSGDHKSHMGLIFNYIDDQNFFLIDLELKNGTKKMSVYQVVNGFWSEREKNISIAHDYNFPGNNDFANDIEFSTRLTVWNSESEISKVKLEMAQVGVNGGNYDEVFTRSYSVGEEQKSSQYAFYIGEPAGNQLKQDGVIIGYKDMNGPPVDPNDPATFQYENVQIQLLEYPSFICENEDGTFTNDEDDSSSSGETSITITKPDFYSDQVVAHSTPALNAGKDEKFQYQFYKNGSWKSGWEDSGEFTGGVDDDRIRIRVLRSGNLVAGPEEFEKETSAVDFGTPSFAYNYSNENSPITINVEDHSIEYLWVEGINNSNAPLRGDSGTESDMHQVSPSGIGTSTGWLWAREYDDEGHGDWIGTPWVGSDEFKESDLEGAIVGADYKVSYDGSFPGMSIEYFGGSNSSWSSSEPEVWSNAEVIQARVMYGETQVSRVIQHGDFEIPFDVDLEITYVNSDGWHIRLLVNKNDEYDYSVESEYKNGNNKVEILFEGEAILGNSTEHVLGKKPEEIEVHVEVKNGSTYKLKRDLESGTFDIPKK